MKKQTGIWIGLTVIVAGASFFAGTLYQKNQTQGRFPGQFDRTQGSVTGQNSSPRSRTGMRPVNGEIIAVDDTSVTVQLADGGSKIVLFSSKTTINKASEAIKSDLKPGEKVMVFGAENPDGSVTAQSIQLNPQTVLPNRGMMNGTNPPDAE